MGCARQGLDGLAVGGDALRINQLIQPQDRLIEVLVQAHAWLHLLKGGNRYVFI